MARGVQTKTGRTLGSSLFFLKDDRCLSRERRSHPSQCPGLGSVPRHEEPRPPDSRVFYFVKWLWLGFARGCPLQATERFDPEFCSDPCRTSGSFWAVPNKSVSFLFYVREIISL